MQLKSATFINPREYWKHEALDFTNWLAEKENLIALEAAVGMELELIGTEQSVGDFRADITCKESHTDNVVIIENQLEQSDHNHLGQLITYCAGLQCHRFIWISPSFREEHIAAVEWLNNNTSTGCCFFAVEVQLLKVDDEDIAIPYFRTVVKPNGWLKRATKSVTALKESDKLRIAFWEQFRDYALQQKGVPFKLQKPLAQNWTNIAIGKSNIYISLIISSKVLKAALTLDGDKAKEQFEYLYTNIKDEATAAIGTGLSWLRKDDCKSCAIQLTTPADYTDQDDWQNQFAWLYKNAVRLYDFFSVKVKTMPF